MAMPVRISVVKGLDSEVTLMKEEPVPWAVPVWIIGQLSIVPTPGHLHEAWGEP